MPHSSEEVSLYERKTAGQDKYTYFLLATAAAAIGFAVQQTSKDSLSLTQIPLALAVISWAYSFWCGCRRLHAVDLSLSHNLTAVQLRNEGAVPLDAINQALDIKNDPLSTDATYYWHAQFYAIVVGGVLFVVWHIIEMAGRTVASAAS